MAFKKWLRKQIGSNSLKNENLDFAEDAVRDKTLPQPKSLNDLLLYLKRKGAAYEALEAAKYCYEMWQALDPKARLDGFGAKDKERLRKATRQVWGWSYPRRLCVQRATDEKGFVYCENVKCESKGEPVPKIHVDHIKPVGVIDRGYLERLFVPSSELQALCGKCHGVKTRRDLKRIRRKKKLFTDIY